MKKALIVMVMVIAMTSLFAVGNSYSSLVIDARGIDLERSRSPKILSEKGYEVYGTIFENLDKALKEGVFFYSPDIKSVEKYAPSRIGKNPLIIKAKKATGPSFSDVVISDLDALKILKENKKSHFLDNFKVIVLIKSPE